MKFFCLFYYFCKNSFINNFNCELYVKKCKFGERYKYRNFYRY